MHAAAEVSRPQCGLLRTSYEPYMPAGCSVFLHLRAHAPPLVSCGPDQPHQPESDSLPSRPYDWQSKLDPVEAVESARPLTRRPPGRGGPGTVR